MIFNLLFGEKEPKACINCQFYATKENPIAIGRPPATRQTGCSHPKSVTKLFNHVTGETSVRLDEQCCANYGGKCWYYKEKEECIP